MKSAFTTYHPAVAFAYLACAIVLSMAALHPVFAALSCMGACVCLGLACGWRTAFVRVLWMVPLVLAVAIANLLFASQGSTELFRLGLRAFYAESFLYGLVMGGMLAATFFWFMVYAAVIDSESSAALFGHFAPVVALMMTQVMRLVPQFVQRGCAVMAAQRASSSAYPRTRRERARGLLTTTSALMEWGMEDGIVRSDAMRARGFGCGAGRTTYKRLRVGRADSVVLTAVMLLAAVDACCIAAACARFRFYPVLAGDFSQWFFVVHAMFLLLPAALQLKEWWQWRS